MKDYNIKKFYNGLKDIKLLTALVNYVSSYGSCIDINKVPKSAPDTPEEAIGFRQIGLYVDEGWTDNYRKALWQNFWHSCCLSSKCDYIFAVLGECNIDREKDIKDIIDLWEKDNLWKYLGSEYGKSYYLDVCMKFFLRRYALSKALKLWWKYNKCSFSVLNLLLPRLIGTILIGFIPLVMADEIWQFPSKLYAGSIITYYVLFSSLFVVSWIYLFIECRNTIGKVNITILVIRSFLVFIGGIIISMFLSFIIVVPLLSPYISTANVSCMQTKLLFASLALFIGIFIQVFWEEKPITEPL